MELNGNPELIEAFRRGDRAVLEGLYRAHADAVARLLRFGFTFSSQGRPLHFRGYEEPSVLQEAIQDSFVHAFRPGARERYDGNQPYGPYLLAIVRNRVLDRLRKERLENELFVSISHAEQDGQDGEHLLNYVQSQQPPEPSPEQDALRSELARILERFTARLSAEDRDVLEMHLLGELTQEQIAERLGTDRNGVRKRIRTIRLRLLRDLKSSGFIATLDEREVMRAVSVLLVANLPIASGMLR